MYKIKLEKEGPDILKLHLLENNVPLSYKKTLELWAGDETFRQFWVDQMQAIPFTGYLWETPPISNTLVSQPFECVFIERSVFEKLKPNTRAYRNYFTTEPVVDFPNLGKNATLIVPCPIAADTAYTHLGRFSGQAPTDQQLALWKRVGVLGLAQLSDKKLWISTHGLGVFWLHIRLDTYPKYYHYKNYSVER